MKLLMRMNCACILRLTFLCCVSVYKFYAHDMIFFRQNVVKGTNQWYVMRMFGMLYVSLTQEFYG